MDKAPNPSAPTFAQWLTHRVGRWCAAPRLTPRLREKGYTVALTLARYNELRAEWERATYGATLDALREHAPAMLQTLQAIAHSQLPPAHSGGFADACHELQDMAARTIQIVEDA